MFINKNIIKKLIPLMFLCSSLYGSEISTTNITIAVLDFDNNSIFNSNDYKPLEAGIAEMMISEFSSIGSVNIVERQKLNAILEELKMSQSGLTKDNSLQAGKIMGANYLVFGSFIVTMKNKIRIDIRVVEVETGLTIKAEEVTGKTKKLLILVQELSEKILNGIDRKLLENERTTFIKGQKLDIEAVIWFSKGIAYRDMNKLEKARYCFREALEIEPDYKQAKEELKLLSINIE